MMARTVSVRAAKARLSRLLDQVGQGEEIVIARSGKPVAALVALECATENRSPGSAAGQVTLSDDFGAPLPEDALRSFEGR